VEASFQHSIERIVLMHEPDFWTNSAEAMELTIEGNRLLAREVADLLLDLWRRRVRWSDGSFLGHWAHRHLPPV
jgi:hypothetical protein